MSTRLESMDLMTARKAKPLVQLFPKSCTATPYLRDHKRSDQTQFHHRSGFYSVLQPTHFRVLLWIHCSSFFMALLFSLMAVAADCRSSDGVLLKDVSESELVGMDDKLDEEGNWLRMFPVSSLILVEMEKFD